MAFIIWMFNLGYLCQHLGTFLQIITIEKKRNIEGVSVDTQILFLIGAIARFFWVKDTMLKDYWLTSIELMLAFISLIYTLFLCLLKYRYSYSEIKSLPIFVRWFSLLILCSVLSYFYFPGDEGQKLDIQMLVSLTMYCEAAGLLPQIWTVNRQKDSTNFSSLYLVFLTISRIFRLIFWVKLYMEDAGFLFLIIADVIHLIMVSGFIYSFFKNFDSLSLPTNLGSVRIEDDKKKIF